LSISFQGHPVSFLVTAFLGWLVRRSSSETKERLDAAFGALARYRVALAGRRPAAD
jgi:hypothetical protein